MFEMYFKAETKAEIIFTKMLPFITVNLVHNEVYETLPTEMEGIPSAKKMVSI